MAQNIYLDKASEAYDRYNKFSDEKKKTWLSCNWIHTDLTTSSKSKVMRFCEKIPLIRWIHRVLFKINFNETLRRLNANIKKQNLPSPQDLEKFISELDGEDLLQKLKTIRGTLKASSLATDFYEQLKSKASSSLKNIDTAFTKWSGSAVSKAIKTLDNKIAVLDPAIPDNSEGVIGILCIDGGGVRGLIPAIIAAKIEEIAGAPLSKLFPVMGGTSIGGLLVSAYSTPNDQKTPKFTASEVVTNFKELAKTVFSTSWDPLKSLFKATYSRDNLQKSCNQFFSSTLFKDNLSEVFIPVADVPNRRANILNSKRTENKYPTLTTEDAVFGTTSAPTYFPLYPLQLGSKTILTGDGGLFLNNPTSEVFETIRKRHPRKHIVVVSIGTGCGDGKLDPKDVQDAGKVYWADKIAPEIMDLSSNNADKLMRKQVAGESRYAYLRIQTKLDPKYGALDNASAEAIAYYEKVADNLIKRHLAEIKAVCAKLR